MVTINETSERTLETSDEIAAYLERRHDLMGDGAPFRAGETVGIVSRAGIPPDLGAGDVAIWLFSAGSGAVWSHVLLLTAGGIETVAQVPTANLAKREAE
ncbi:hypothetical protein ACQKJ1_05450 [Methylorubrum rhodesianum]|uniref:hypothetical protein n=1 Tax=Methylorubrum rhodesianum TaxID=29427 RepID=UPI003D0441D6